MADKPTLAFCIPNYGPLDACVYHNHLAVVAHASRTFDIKCIGSTDKMYLHTASNALVRGALEANVDYIFWTENDMLLPFDVVEKLHRHRKDICSGLYFLRSGSYQPCLYVRNDEMIEDDSCGFVPISIFPENELFKVQACGCGCVLFKADMFRGIEEPWFNLDENKYGQDMYFYKKVYDKKIDVYADTSVQCEQLGDKVKTSIEDYRKYLKDPNSRARGFIQASSGIKI